MEFEINNFFEVILKPIDIDKEQCFNLLIGCGTLVLIVMLRHAYIFWRKSEWRIVFIKLNYDRISNSDYIEDITVLKMQDGVRRIKFCYNKDNFTIGNLKHFSGVDGEWLMKNGEDNFLLCFKDFFLINFISLQKLFRTENVSNFNQHIVLIKRGKNKIFIRNKLFFQIEGD